MNAIDKEAFNELHKALYEIVLQDEEEEDLIVVNEDIMELMDDDFIWNTDNWLWSNDNGWIPDVLAPYYLEHWHGRINDDI